MNYHLARNNEQLGVFTSEEIQKGLEEGTYLTTDLAWTSTMTDWKPLGTLPEFMRMPSDETSTPAPDAPVVVGPGGAIDVVATTLPPVHAPGSYQSAQAIPQHVSVGVTPTPGTAIASLVLGILSLVTCYFGILFAIPGIICGHLALKSIRESGNRLQGRGLAIAGLVMNYLWIGLCVLVIVFIVLAGGIAALTQEA